MRNCITKWINVVLHLQAVGEALCNLALISLSGKKNHITQWTKESRFNKKESQDNSDGAKVMKEGGETKTIIEYLCFRSSLLWRWSLERKHKYTHRHIMRTKLEKYCAIRE